MATAVREQELRVLSMKSPTKLPLAHDAQRMLEQWLKSDHDTATTSLGLLMTGTVGPVSQPANRRDSTNWTEVRQGKKAT